jgi:hypothetical protein
MTRLILHVGHPKTGTTALQTVLAANSKRLLSEASILYPTQTTPGNEKHALAIPWLLGFENHAIRRQSRAAGPELRRLSRRYWQSIVEECRSSHANVVVLSAEGFWSFHQTSQTIREHFRQELLKIAGSITIAGYLRSPASYCLSKINQKRRNFRDFRPPSSSYLRTSMEAWESAGFEAYCWRLFERQKFTNGDIVDDFCSQHLSLSSQSIQLQRSDIERANKSVSNEALAIFEDLARRFTVLKHNIYDPRRSQLARVLLNADQVIGGERRPHLHADVARAITARSADLPWLRDRGLLFADVDPAWIGRPEAGTLPESTEVAAWCPINRERLTALKAEVAEAIAHLFRPDPMLLLQALRRGTAV